MHNRTDVIYVYDATFEGFLCCVYSYYYTKFIPVAIISEENIEATLYDIVTIETNMEYARKVKDGIINKISLDAYDYLKKCMLTCLDNKEMYMLRFVMKGFNVGKSISRLLGDSDVSVLFKATKHLDREKHLYLGIVRFYKAEDVYIASIKPKNQLLPLIKYHFTQRFSNQSFMIYDETNSQALLYSNNESKIIKVDNIELPPVTNDELETQRLWKLFYDTIAIKERYNPKCRMNFLPKRTWDRLTEMQNLGENFEKTQRKELTN